MVWILDAMAQTACGRRMTMTVADWIRGMTDLELAMFFENVIHERDVHLIEKLAKQGVVLDLVELRPVAVAKQLEYLQSPFGGE